MGEMTEARKGMPNCKAFGPDDLPAELLKIDHRAFAQWFHNILANVWVAGGVPLATDICNHQGPSQTEIPN